MRRPRPRRFRRLYGFGVGPGEKSIRIAITYHYSLSFGGSERVLETLAKMYPEADFFALFVDPAFLPEALRGRKITTSFLDRIPGREARLSPAAPFVSAGRRGPRPFWIRPRDQRRWSGNQGGPDRSADRASLLLPQPAALVLGPIRDESAEDAVADPRSLRSGVSIFAAMGLRRGTASRRLHHKFGIRRRPGAQVLPAREHRHLSTGGYERRLACRET